MRYTLSFLIFILLLGSCTENSKYDGYSLTNSGLNYKIHSLGDELVPFSDQNIISFNYRIYNANDSVLRLGKSTFYWSNKSYPIWSELLGLLAVNDSASAYFGDATQIPIELNIGKKTPFRIDLRLTNIEKIKEVEFSKDYPNLVKLIDHKEKEDLIAVLARYNSDSILYYKGIFVIHQIVGEGLYPQKGDEVFVDYVLLDKNGKQLDSTYEREADFSFIKGTKGQVLDGFSLGIETMKTGGKAIFIIPSYFAFGKNGSSTGIIKKNQTIKCKVSICEILRK